MSNRWVDELMPDQPMWVRDLVDEELRRKEASVERTARAFRACEQAREDAAALHRAEIERLQGAVVEAATQEGQRVATLCDALVRTAEHERNEARTEVERLRAGNEELVHALRLFTKGRPVRNADELLARAEAEGT